MPQSKGCLVEVQGRVVGDHASWEWAGGESVRSHLSLNTLETFPYLLLSDQVTVKIIVLVEYSF